jgi:hypothetical protein
MPDTPLNLKKISKEMPITISIDTEHADRCQFREGRCQFAQSLEPDCTDWCALFDCELPLDKTVPGWAVVRCSQCIATFGK